MRFFVSQPMVGLTSTQIEKQLHETKLWLETYFGKSVDIQNAYIKQEAPASLHDGQIGVWYLMESLKIMSECHAVVMVGEWWKNRGCVLEYRVAKEYGLPIIVREISNV